MLADHGATIVDNEFWLRGNVFGMAIHGKADCLLQLAGNELIIVDHKKSGSKKRRARLEAGGWPTLTTKPRDQQIDLAA
jgi:hypothetical protein